MDRTPAPLSQAFCRFGRFSIETWNTTGGRVLIIDRPKLDLPPYLQTEGGISAMFFNALEPTGYVTAVHAADFDLNIYLASTYQVANLAMQNILFSKVSEVLEAIATIRKLGDTK